MGKEIGYSEILKTLLINVGNLKISCIEFKDALQTQFLKEFDNGSTSHNRGLLYAQCGTNCQAIIRLLKAIENDLDLIDDLPLKPKESDIIHVF